MENNKLKKWPTWLRWALAYPLAAIGALLIAWIIRIAQGLFQEETASWWLDLSQDFFIGFIFVYISAWFAPKANLIVAIISLCVTVALVFTMVGFGILATIYGNNLLNPLLYYISLAAILAGGISATILIHNEIKDSSS